MWRKIHNFRVAAKPIAFRICRYGLIGAVVSFAAAAALTQESRIILLRCFGIFFSISLSGFFIYFAAFALDEAGRKRYGTVLWMAAWTALMGLLIFTGIQTAMQDF